MILSDASPTSSPEAIDPRTLGRPMHLLPAFAARFGADLSEWLRLGPNRRYGTGLEFASATMRAFGDKESPARWAIYTSPSGRIGLAMPRGLVLRLLQCRYGLDETGEADPASVALTASEERLARVLGQQMVSAMAQRIRDGLAPADGDGEVQPLDWSVDSGLPTGPWRLEVVLTEPQRGARHVLQFSLDDGWMGLLLDQLGRGRTLVRDQAATPAEPLAGRLKLRLVARLLQQRMPLGHILDLRVGSVLPIPQPQTVVLVKDSPLFNASVAEHKGRLWLTGFQDI